MKTIAVITPKVDTFSNPTLVYLFEQLIERNYRILFFAHGQMFIPSNIRPGITFCELPFNFYEFRHGVWNYIKVIRQYLKLFGLLKYRNKVEELICIDPFGLVIGGRIKKIIKLTLIYFSFEIFFEDEFFIERKKIIKRLENKYSGETDLLIIQDSKREELIRSVNKFPSEMETIHIPVSPKPPEYQIDKYNIHAELNIPEDKRIVVYSGTLMAWSGINELLDLIPDKFGEEFWLLIHSHHRLNDDEELKIRINNLADKNYNLTFHNKPFYEASDYYRFLSCCHIGIATYFPNTTDVYAGRNIREIGLSSGKFSTYMMLGLPTVTTSNAIYKKFNEIYNFGDTISKSEEIPESLKLIMRDYKKKSEGCRNLYNNELNPVSKFEKFFDYIEKH